MPIRCVLPSLYWILCLDTHSCLGNLITNPSRQGQIVSYQWHGHPRPPRPPSSHSFTHSAKTHHPFPARPPHPSHHPLQFRFAHLHPSIRLGWAMLFWFLHFAERLADLWHTLRLAGPGSMLNASRKRIFNSWASHHRAPPAPKRKECEHYWDPWYPFIHGASIDHPKISVDYS